MKTRTLLSIGLSAFVLTGTTIGVAPGLIAAVASSAENPERAAAEANRARRAIAQRKADKAVRFAESAVGYAPRVAEYRALLGQAYLLAGRFASARQALSDAMSLDPSDGRVALNLALAQIAQGDWAGARQTLDNNESIITASDRGLAYALAGDPVRAVEVLTSAARAADATPKTRQNLALSLALAGRWPEAKAIAAVDLPADQLDARIMQWATFSRPTNAYDQVASLLGVSAVADPGQPVQLALVAPAPETGLASTVTAPDVLDSYMPGVPDNAGQVLAETNVEVPLTHASQLAPVEIAGTSGQVVFGPRQEIVQQIQVSAPRTAPAPTQLARVVAPDTAPGGTLARGNFYVQLGAFANSGVARDSWRRTAQRIPEVGRHTPQGARVATRAGNFYRLSVGGFARADADALCSTVRARGGNCFVRAAAGDQVASWARTDRQVASR